MLRDGASSGSLKPFLDTPLGGVFLRVQHVPKIPVQKHFDSC